MIYVKHKIYIYMGTYGKIKKYLNSALPRVYNENKMIFYWNFSLGIGTIKKTFPLAKGKENRYNKICEFKHH